MGWFYAGGQRRGTTGLMKYSTEAGERMPLGFSGKPTIKEGPTTGSKE
jgi:hypothetical protein